jgi:hypothetical protein
MTGAIRAASLLLAATILLAACGQYAGVHEHAAARGAAGLGASGGDGDVNGFDELVAGEDLGVEDFEAGAGEGGEAGSGSGNGTGAGSAGQGAGESGDGEGGSAGGSGSGGGSAGNGSGGDSTGVSDDKIVIGIHAPLTGAAPLRQASFDAGKDLYWKHGADGSPVTINGRQVEIVFADDRYRPSHARQVCQQMAEQRNAFVLIGGGGTDQIQACAQYAASKGIPYLSAGVTEIGLRRLSNYFPASQSYPQQANLLASYIKRQLNVTDPSRVAAVITNTPNFDDAAQAFAKAFPDARIIRPDKNEGGSSTAGSLCAGTVKQYDVVFPLTSPTFYLEMAAAAPCRPLYVGVGVSMGLDSVASVGCEAGGATQNARFFSPAPAFEDARQGKFDAGFMKAANAAGVAPDDIMWLLWGQSKVLHHMLENAGQDLTREGFIASNANSRVRTGVFPDLVYRPSDRFGAQHVHVLRNVCERRGNAAGYYVTESAFVSSF